MWRDTVSVYDPENLLEIICFVTGCELHEVLGNSRERHLITARFLYYACLRDSLGWSWPAIGKFVGRNHTTVMSGAKSVPHNLVQEVRVYIEGHIL